jgi:hypothetical protein
VIAKNITALERITEYIMARLKLGEYHTWAGRFFDWLCASLECSTSYTRDAKLFCAGRMFNRIAEAPRYNPAMCEASQKQYTKTWNDGKLGEIKKQFQIKM